MKKAFIVLLAVCGMLSCSNSDSEPTILNGILTGEFIEVTPISNRTTLIFSANSNQLQEKRTSDGENPISRTFSIQLVDDGMIELSSNEADEMSPKVFHYQIIDDNIFEIGNINHNDNEDTIMTFKRI
ncbi:hypothetical protein ACFQZJ_13255 [Maribacter chungangensis]|uniref:Copper resistance protein NlpE n=1 Tax=Maribacter chungangensis TaxID=1069117 RepID=A0ABW3B6L4_9FLAO